MELEKALWRFVFSFEDFTARQLRHPSGPMGRLFLRAMNRVNAGMNERTLEALELSTGDSVLELGFGGGDLLAMLEATGLCPRLAGVDRSRAALSLCRSRFPALVASGTLTLEAGSVEALPFPEGTFSRVCGVNVVYFWPDLDAALASCRRVLAPSGRVVLTYNAKAFLEKRGLAQRGFAAREPAEIEEAMRRNALGDVRTASARDATNRLFFTTRGTAAPASAPGDGPGS